MLARHHHPNVYTEKVSPRRVQHVVSRKPNLLWEVRQRNPNAWNTY